MLFLFLLNYVYPLLIGLPDDTTVNTPSSLAIKENLPDNMCVFIISQDPRNPIADLRDLKLWGGSSRWCENVGVVRSFSNVDSNIFNFLQTMKDVYDNRLHIDARVECGCKIQRFKGGLVTVVVDDNEIEAISEVVSGLPPGTGIAFIPADGYEGI